jgi:hypothetical protein
MLTYDSGADGHYISEKDRRKAGLPIMSTSTRKVGVANGGTSKAKYVTQLPFRQLSAQAMQADTFQDFPTSLMSVGKTADNDTVSVFTKESVNVFKEEDVLITCKGEPILIGIRDSHGQYRIRGKHSDKPTVSTISHQPNKPSNGCTPYVVTR